MCPFQYPDLESSKARAVQSALNGEVYRGWPIIAPTVRAVSKKKIFLISSGRLSVVEMTNTDQSALRLRLDQTVNQ